MHLLLVKSAMSLLWIANQAELLRVSLGRGLFKMRGELLSASTPADDSGILVPVDVDLHRRIVGVMSVVHFPGGQGRLLREGIDGFSEDKKEEQMSSRIVLV